MFRFFKKFSYIVLISFSFFSQIHATEFNKPGVLEYYCKDFSRAFPAEDPMLLKTPEDISSDYLWLLSEECKQTGIMFDYHE